jgi:hypothetical protein
MRVLYGVQSKKWSRKFHAKRLLYFSLHFVGRGIKSTIKRVSRVLCGDSHISVDKGSSFDAEMIIKIQKDFISKEVICLMDDEENLANM